MFVQQSEAESVRQDVTVIIRSAGERTTDLSHQLLREQVPTRNITVICEYPFTRALRKSFELGCELGRPWTLCVDADVLLWSSSIEILFNWVRAADSKVFQIQANLFDTIFGGPRKVGIRLYRTSLLGKALSCIPSDGVTLRPETFVCEQMASLGFPSVYRNQTIGLHDFEQCYRDIYRKAFVHAHKHEAYMQLLEPLWQRLAGHDPDYEVALWGFRAGQLSNDTVPLDVRCFPRDLSPLLVSQGWQEKKELKLTNDAEWDVDKLIIEYGHTRASARDCPLS